MSLRDEANLLRSIPPFATLGASQLKLLAFASERLAYLPGEILIRQGDRGDAVYVILDGNAEVTIQEAGGQRKLRDLGRHAFIGEIAVLETTARTATVTATRELEALKIDRDVLFRMVKDTPDLGDRLKAHLAAADYDKD